MNGKSEKKLYAVKNVIVQKNDFVSTIILELRKSFM